MNNHYNVGKDNPMYGKKRPGHAAAMYGRKHSLKTKEQMGLIKNGENNPNWHDDVGYFGLHAWVKRHLPKPELCENCNESPAYDLANITGIYDRDFINWKYYCRGCHMLSDGRMDKLKQYRRKLIA